MVNFSYKDDLLYIPFFILDFLMVAVKPKPPVKDGYDNDDDDEDLVKSI